MFRQYGSCSAQSSFVNMVVVVQKSALSPYHPIDVICGSLPAKLFPDKLKDGSSRCISFTSNGSFMTPCDFFFMMDCPCLPPPAHKWPVLDKPGLS